MCPIERVSYSVFCFDSEKNLLRVLELNHLSNQDIKAELRRLICDETVFLGYIKMPLSNALKMDNLSRHFTMFTAHKAFDISVPSPMSHV